MSNNIKEKQKDLKEWITKIGMTQKHFIEQYCIDNFNFTDEEIEQYYEKFKKEITRTTTKIEVLDKYFEFLYSLDEFKKIGYVKPFYIDDGTFDKNFNEKMKKISENITNFLQK
ncbi:MULTISPECIES: hypothetical protein [Aliarcobacter]|uniref:Uncharacterized protein n=1 Tax=Aliarcobacter skirrowii CCUG 10374 TaxID=1032239 RepID=A0AAD0SKZ9_9BACT|nr:MULTISPECIES: hypothetical protein [Aliarcobacter]AXX84652.1 hypothetical protein ASKIR_0832 [Aliarcobacter skirrowii CCUG 10374]KAB0620197.1 hypothetical protein F7P70_08075 [Aliarcobacter skirrowii CCUG 10374]OCL85524.1 hypothetical protein AAX26_01952 [Aliarcobacter thereius]RXI25380.1 hypothetical protein CP959_08105 [Aliarcobacter skirrowii CCUG 10374]SUV14823.1 Uncharacterised protein [Aliarcobacter skirrowii]